MGQHQAPPDSYAVFLARLDAATTSLDMRARSVDKALSAVSLLLGGYQGALRLWEQRRVRTSRELVRHSGDPQMHATLSELHETAAQMESLHRSQALRLTERVSALRRRRDAIGQSLAALTDSRAKLHASRKLSQDREKLSGALFELAGAGGPTGIGGPAFMGSAHAKIPDLGLRDDLRKAREAVILAEALIEVKGD